MSYSQDRPRWQAVVIPSQGGGPAILVPQIESFSTSKDDNGDAGTWNFSAPLAQSLSLAQSIACMDLVAIYVTRWSDSHIPTAGAYPGPSNDTLAGATWGSAGASITVGLGAPDECLMIGMVDGHRETIGEDAATATLEVWGRDLTKILIDNDVGIPFDISIHDQYLMISTIALSHAYSGTALLERILDMFVGKSLAALYGDSSARLAGVDEAKYKQLAFPWRNFIRTDLLDPGFMHFPANMQEAVYSVQEGSAWSNVQTLRNAPLTRIFVNEIGQLIFDDAFSAWGYGKDAVAYTMTITDEDLRQRVWESADDDVVTLFCIQVAQSLNGTSKVAAGWQLATAYANTPGDIQRFGYRNHSFLSQYDPADTSPEILATTRLPVLVVQHNDTWRGTVTVRGDPRYRVGLRVRIANIFVAHTDLQGMTTAAGLGWYIEKVEHTGSWGEDYTTTLSLRFSQAEAAPTLTGLHG